MGNQSQSHLVISKLSALLLGTKMTFRWSEL
jgi:hypothetical protein